MRLLSQCATHMHRMRNHAVCVISWDSEGEIRLRAEKEGGRPHDAHRTGAGCCAISASLLSSVKGGFACARARSRAMLLRRVLRQVERPFLSAGAERVDLTREAQNQHMYAHPFHRFLSAGRRVTIRRSINLAARDTYGSTAAHGDRLSRQR